MKVNEIRVERKYNLGNYETVGVTVSISPETSDENKSWDELLNETSGKLGAQLVNMKNKLLESEKNAQKTTNIENQ